MKKLIMINALIFISLSLTGCAHKKKVEVREPASVAAPTEADLFFEEIEQSPSVKY